MGCIPAKKYASYLTKRYQYIVDSLTAKSGIAYELYISKSQLDFSHKQLVLVNGALSLEGSSLFRQLKQSIYKILRVEHQ